MTDDPLDRLRAADPLRDSDPPSASDHLAIAMRERILARSTSPLASIPTRRWVAGGAVLAASVAAAAALAVRTAPVADPTTVGCYAGPSVTADTAVVGALGTNPVEQCRQLWQTGDMDPAITSPDQVPTLVACVLETGGSVGVFPAGSCDDVDTRGQPIEPFETPGVVATPDPTTTTATPTPSSTETTGTEDPTGLAMPDFNVDDETVRQALDEIRLAMLDRCLTLQAAIELAEDTLASHGVEGWTVGPIFEGHTDRTCAGFFPDAEERAVWFTPEPAQEGQTPGPA